MFALSIHQRHYSLNLTLNLNIFYSRKVSLFFHLLTIYHNTFTLKHISVSKSISLLQCQTRSFQMKKKSHAVYQQLLCRYMYLTSFLQFFVGHTMYQYIPGPRRKIFQKADKMYGQDDNVSKQHNETLQYFVEMIRRTYNDSIKDYQLNGREYYGP